MPLRPAFTERWAERLQTRLDPLKFYNSSTIPRLVWPILGESLEAAMHAHRAEPSLPAWRGDELDSEDPPEIEAPYFDEALSAWVLSRHADVLAAFRSPSLAPGSGRAAPLEESCRLKMREETLDALAPAQVSAWREKLAPLVEGEVRKLPVDDPVEILKQYARPLCLTLAAMVTRLDVQAATGLLAKAHLISAAAAEPYDSTLRSRAQAAEAELKSFFPCGPDALRDSGFVALSQTLPCILGNAWFALVQRPQEWRRLHQQPELVAQAVEELLRYAGLVRILFRTATEDVDLNGYRIRKGERVVLRITAANRDTERFPNANELDLMRRDAGHFTFGASRHSCVAASLIRMAAICITGPLLQRFACANLLSPVAWQGGSGFRSPASLWIRLSDA